MDKSKIEKLEVLMKYVTSKNRGYYKGQMICKGEPDFDFFLSHSIIAMPGEDNDRIVRRGRQLAPGFVGQG